MSPVLKRTLVGLTVGAGVVAFFLYCPLKVVPLVMLPLTLLVQLEFYQMVKKYEPVTWAGLAVGASWMILNAAYPGLLGFSGCLIALGAGVVPFVFLLSTIVLFSSRYRNPIGTIASTLFGCFYVPFLLSFFLRLIQLAPDPGKLFAMPESRVGFYTLFALIALAKFSDTGGFAFGVTMGKHKMCPSISPNKSWEGLAGSAVFATMAAAVLLAFAKHFNWAESCCLWGYLEWWMVPILGVVFALVATAGDLIESRFKRECGVKDSSTFMPAGMGGFLDMFDSFIFLPALVYPLELWCYWGK